jgi:uncharacterized membrane protein
MFKTKYEFLAGLEKELGRVGVADKSEILADFELHFADSKAQNLSEAEICAKLGSISEIAKQYAEEEIYPVVAVETINNEQGTMRKKNKTTLMLHTKTAELKSISANLSKAET